DRGRRPGRAVPAHRTPRRAPASAGALRTAASPPPARRRPIASDRRGRPGEAARGPRTPRERGRRAGETRSEHRDPTGDFGFVGTGSRAWRFRDGVTIELG